MTGITAWRLEGDSCEHEGQECSVAALQSAHRDRFHPLSGQELRWRGVIGSFASAGQGCARRPSCTSHCTEYRGTCVACSSPPLQTANFGSSSPDFSRADFSRETWADVDPEPRLQDAICLLSLSALSALFVVSWCLGMEHVQPDRSEPQRLGWHAVRFARVILYTGRTVRVREVRSVECCEYIWARTIQSTE